VSGVLQASSGRRLSTVLLELAGILEQARLRDEQDYQDAMLTFASEQAEWEKLRNLARRILAGEHKAYTEALVEFSELAEISDLGSSVYFTVQSAKLLECVLKVNGKQAIPAEVKSLTATEKLSVKPMPKARFYEIYKDYLCGCVLRVAREVFALLPIETLLLTASADALDPGTGHDAEQSVLSAAMPRPTVERLDFERLTPSDAMANFRIRMDFQALRKTGQFQPVAPLTPGDIIGEGGEDTGYDDLIATVRRVREEVKLKTAELSKRAEEAVPQVSPSP
jgi:hypothetical protein